MTPVATVLIPVSAAHYATNVYMRALESARNQTVECDVQWSISPETPAKLRNTGMDVSTPFVVFLDCDDWIEPTFIEQCLRAYEQGYYVYTGYHMGYKTVTPSDESPFADGHHLVTTLYPTEAFKYLNGFDETLPGGEDLDFYLRSIQAGVCGKLCPLPLVHYTANGNRSEAYFANPDYHNTQAAIWQRYGGKQVAMACCGLPGEQAQIPAGERVEGDLLSEALWAGIRTEIGHKTGRKYRGGNRSKIWVAPADIEAAPSLYRPVPNPKAMSPDRANVLKMAGLLDDSD